MPPILQLRNVPHNRVIRREQLPPQAFTLGGYLLALACFIVLLVWQARDLKLGLLTAGGFLLALGVSALVAWLVLHALQRLKPNASLQRFIGSGGSIQPSASVPMPVAGSTDSAALSMQVKGMV